MKTKLLLILALLSTGIAQAMKPEPQAMKFRRFMYYAVYGACIFAGWRTCYHITHGIALKNELSEIASGLAEIDCNELKSKWVSLNKGADEDSESLSLFEKAAFKKYQNCKELHIKKFEREFYDRVKDETREK